MPAFAAPARRLVLASFLSSGLLAPGGLKALAQAPADLPPAVRPGSPLPASSAVLMVQSGLRDAESDAQFQRRIQTHVATIASEHHLLRVVEGNSDVRATQWFRATSDNAERAAWLRDHLRVAAVPGTSLIEIAVSGVADPGERKTLVQEVGNTYLQSRQSSQKDALPDRTATLNQLKQKVESRLTQLSAEMRRKQQETGADHPIGRLAIKEAEFSKMIAEQVDASTRARKAAEHGDAIDQAIRANQAIPGLDGHVRRVAPFLDNDDAQLRQVEVEAQLTRQQFGENNPKVLALAKRLELMRANHDKRLEEARAKARLSVLEEAKQEAAGAAAKSETITRRVDQIKSELADLSNATKAFSHLKEEEKALREQVRQIREQIDTVIASSSSQGDAARDIHWHLPPRATPAR